jgi:hypothetical protein
VSKEPAVIISTVTAFATAVIGALVAFGVDFTQEQRDAILTTLAAGFAVILVLGPIIRTFVFSPNTTQNLVNKAEEAGVKDAPAPVVQP